MEKVSYLRRRRFDNTEAKHEKPRREFTFIVITALTLIGPTLLLCLAMGQWWPLLLMTSSDVLGATLGVAKFNRPVRAVASCVPARTSSTCSLSTEVTSEKKAA
jgi:hypothetical protein